MKKSVLLFSFSVLVICTVMAQDFNLSGQKVLRSKYVGPDGLTFYDKPVIQGNITLDHKSGFFVDLWISSGLNTNWSTDWDDEMDYTLGWSGKIKPIQISTSISYFDDINIWQFSYNDVIKSEVRIDLPKKINKWLEVIYFVDYANYFIPDKKTPFNGGNIYSLGIDNEIIISEKIKITPSVQFSYDDGAFEVKPGCFIKMSSNLNLTLTKHFVWNIVEATFYGPLGEREMKNQLILGTGLSWTL